MRSIGDGLPVWVRAAALLGVPAVIALFLVYQLARTWTTQMDRIEAAVSQHETHRAHDMQSMNAFLYAICLNTADGDVERARCAIALDGGLSQK